MPHIFKENFDYLIKNYFKKYEIYWNYTLKFGNMNLTHHNLSLELYNLIKKIKKNNEFYTNKIPVNCLCNLCFKCKFCFEKDFINVSNIKKEIFFYKKLELIFKINNNFNIIETLCYEICKNTYLNHFLSNNLDILRFVFALCDENITNIDKDPVIWKINILNTIGKKIKILNNINILIPNYSFYNKLFLIENYSTSNSSITSKLVD